ncbi:MAG: hypothetical protein K8J09_15220, partial [Planctomycetes bacterium]|nr:hypothetical protein [Planctomycetota bacterium]
MGQNILRPIQQYDDRDNRTNFIYGQSGRLERIEYPNGLDEVYNFSPSWIGAAPYLQSEYSGVDISLVVRATGQPIAGKGKKLLFKHPKDVYGQVIPGCRPFAGDLLFRQYFESCRILDDVANPSGNETYDIPQNLDAPTKMQVMEYSYVPGTTLLASVSQFTCSDIYDANKSNVSEIVAYEYANLGGRARVAVEVRQMEGVRFHFYYTFKTLKDKHEQYAVETITQTDEQGGVYVRTLDDYGRVVSETITPQVGAGIESRLGDPLAAGQVEPASLTRNYEYATPNCACGDSPTAVIDVTANRRSDYVYDPMTGLLLQESHPNPAGGAGHADTVYMWQPAVSGDIYGAYRLVSRTEPDGAVWTYNYTVGPRINAAWGVKTLAVTMTSPSVSASTANPGPLVWHKTLDTSAPVFDANGAQACIVGHVQHELDADGLVVDYTYDSRGYLAETVRNLGGGDLEVRTLVGFDATGDVVSMTDYAGSAKEHAVTIARDGRGRPYSIMDAASGVQREQRLYYDRWDNLCVTLESNKTGTGGAPDDFGPNPRSDVARAWIRNEFHYEGSQLVMVLEDRRSLDRNDSGAIADANDARFVRSDFSYSPSGLLLSATLGTGSTTHFTYDGYGALYKRVVTDNASNSVTTERLYVNNALEVTRRVDGLGNAWDITRNDAGLVTRAADPAIATVPSGYPWPAIQKARKLVYDVAGRVLESQIVLVNGGAETLVRREVSTLDEVGRAYKHAIYDGTSATPMQTLEARFVGSSRTDKQTDPAGRFWTRSFDALGRVVEVQDCTSGNPDKVQYEYIPKTDFVLRETRQHWDAAASGGGQYVARVTEYERDSLGRPLQIRVGPQGAQLVHAFSYYSTGETESYTDPSGKVERYLPDARGRLVERFLPGVAPIWNGTTYKDWVGSDCTSELLQTDGLGHTTRTIFDFAGRPTVVMEPGATVMPTPASPHQAFARLMSYDAASRLATVYYSEDIEIAMHRDSAGRLLQRRRVVDGNAVNLSVVSWLWWYDNLRYDALGEVSETNSYTLSDDEYIHETIGRDVAGRKLSESYDFIGGVGGPDIVSGFVGGDSFRSTVGIVNGGFPEDLHVRYAPDATGRVAGIEWQVNANGWKPLASYQHEGQSIRRRSMSLALGVPPGGQVPQFDTTYSYDAYGRMSKIEQSFSSAASVDFYFDAASNLVKEVYGKKSGATGDRFAYDEHHRLQTAWMDSNQVHLPTQDSNEIFIKKLTYGLDAVHNRTTVAEQAGQGGGTTTIPYSLDSLSNRYGSVGGSTLIYDARGNLTFDGVCYYIYDALNRLTEVYKREVVGQSGSMASMQSGASSATSEKSFAVHDQ